MGATMTQLPAGYQRVSKPRKLPPGYSKAEAPTEEKDSGWDDFRQGVAAAGVGTALGAKELFGDVSDAERQSYADLKADYKESGWGTAGRMTGELAQLAVPGVAGIKLYRALSALNQARKGATLLPLAADVAGSAGIGAVRLPGEGETRGGNAAMEAGAAVIGDVGGRVLRTTFAGVKGTPEAIRMRDRGIPITAGQAVGGKVRDFENLMGMAPMGARAMDTARIKSERGIKEFALRDAAPPTPATIFSANPERVQISMSSREARNQLEKAYDEAYAAAFTTADKMAPGTGRKIRSIQNQAGKNLTDSEKRMLDNVVKDMDSLVKKNPQISVSELDSLLRKRMRNNPDFHTYDEALGQIQDALRAGQPSQNQLALRRTDEGYGKYVAIREAVATDSASQMAGEFGLGELNAGARRAATRYTKGTDNQPFLGLLDDSFKVRGHVPGVIPDKSRRWLQFFPDLGGAAGFTNRRIAGVGVGQKKAREILESELAKQLRYGASGARLGSAAYDDSYTDMLPNWLTGE